jgi:uncharacterized protein DUF6894
MPRFYFHLTSKDSYTPDDNGKELATLNDAYVHARKLIDKILYHVGSDDAKAWKIVISNDENDARIIVPFPISCSFLAQRPTSSNALACLRRPERRAHPVKHEQTNR